MSACAPAAGAGAAALLAGCWLRSASVSLPWPENTIGLAPVSDARRFRGLALVRTVGDPAAGGGAGAPSIGSTQRTGLNHLSCMPEESQSLPAGAQLAERAGLSMGLTRLLVPPPAAPWQAPWVGPIIIIVIVAVPGFTAGPTGATRTSTRSAGSRAQVSSARTSALQELTRLVRPPRGRRPQTPAPSEAAVAEERCCQLGRHRA